jgi:hypothetical protein
VLACPTHECIPSIDARVAGWESGRKSTPYYVHTKCP